MTIFMKSVYIDFHINNELLYRFNKYCMLNNNIIVGHTASRVNINCPLYRINKGHNRYMNIIITLSFNISMFYALLEQY